MPTMADTPLRLLAFDTDDLSVLSAHFQDATLTVGEIAWLPREKRFAFAADRFDWAGSALGEGNRRRRAAVHFERVTAVKSKGVDLDAKDTMLNLLAIAFEPTDAPAGAVDLLFSGDACIRLEVECLEAAMKDLGPVWEIEQCPGHALDEDA
jgi:hypothetical protein